MIETLVQLPPERWKSVATKMRWVKVWNRGVLSDIPPEVLPLGDASLDIDVWERVKREVNRARRAAYRERLNLRHKSREDRRREYMRNYMSNYRKRKT